ncbi:MAG TPA: enoyl-CoA hydratase/isomerase family protein [Caulobacteraceae bacterium]
MSAPPALPDLDIRIDGAIAEVRLSRPQARNALSLALIGQLIEAAAFFRASTDVQAVILTGTDAYFSAGADLADPDRAQGGTRLEQRQRMRVGPDMCAAWEALEQVTIAAIEGYCIGGGAALAVSLDFRIAGEGAYLRLPEIALGMNMSWGALPRVAALVGPARAKRFAIFCEPCDADQALAWGMIDEKTAKGGALAAARAWAAKVAALPPLPVRMTKEAINAGVNALHRAASAMDRDQWMLTSETSDFREGAAAFLQKRAPKFRGD